MEGKLGKLGKVCKTMSMHQKGTCGEEAIWHQNKASVPFSTNKRTERSTSVSATREQFVAWKWDQAGSKLPRLIELLKDLQGRDIEFLSLTEQIDTTTQMDSLSSTLYFS